nr:MAG TPA: hypothetical protein [Caudoviricetes sp.]
MLSLSRQSMVSKTERELLDSFYLLFILSCRNYEKTKHLEHCVGKYLMQE